MAACGALRPAAQSAGIAANHPEGDGLGKSPIGLRPYARNRTGSIDLAIGARRVASASAIQR